MKISNLAIKNFKQFKNLSLDFTYPKGHEKEGKPLDKICIIGQSGTGKTNLLDVIKKSVIDFSNNQASYKPFNEFVGQSTDDKYITNIFYTKSDIEIKAFFTKDKSQIDFKKIDDLNLFNSFERNYFLGTEKVSIIQKNQDTKVEIPETDKTLLEGYLEHRKLLISRGINVYGVAGFEKELIAIDEKISDMRNKYNTISDSLMQLKTRNFIDRYIININDENENIWKIMKSKIDEYSILESQYNTFLVNKTFQDKNYSTDDLRRDSVEWKEKNENLLEKISFVLNDILKYFNLELTKIDENQKSYRGLVFRDLSNGSIVEYENLSTGTKNLISTFIPLKTYSPKDSILIVDEPENSFYPNIQKLLTNLYVDSGENNQVIFATHSPIIASSFEPWEVVELKFDANNQIYREVYFEGENHIDNYFIDPRMLTWTGILTDVFDLKEDSNFTFREKKLMEYASLKAQIKELKDEKEKESKFIELKKISKILGLKN